MFTRRTFLKFSSAGVLTLYTLDKFGIERAIAAIPGGTLLPEAIPKFVTPLFKPPAMPRAGLLKYKIAAGSSSSKSCRPSLPRRPCGATAP